MNLFYYKLLRTGVKHWNKWRADNVGNKPDLSGADLSHSPFYKSTEDPFSNYLSHADFTATDLTRSDLADVCLAGCNFSFANLTEANFATSDLTGATLKDAIILGTKFDYACVDRADFSGAILGNLCFVGVDLSAAVGLGALTCESSIIIDRSSLKNTADGLAKDSRNMRSLRTLFEKSGNAILLRELEAATETARRARIDFK